jgi:hypothetical protein
MINRSWVTKTSTKITKIQEAKWGTPKKKLKKKLKEKNIEKNVIYQFQPKFFLYLTKLMDILSDTDPKNIQNKLGNLALPGI